jgi:predicted metalloprotease
MKPTRTLTIALAITGLLATAVPAAATSLPTPHPKPTHRLDGKVRGDFPAAPKFRLPAGAERAPRVNNTRTVERPDAPIQRTRRPGSAGVAIDRWEGTFDRKLGSVLYYVRNYFGRAVTGFRQPTVYRDAAQYNFRCGNSQPAPIRGNAVFCSNPYYVAFDTNWFTAYNNWASGGDMAWGIILAHEFGHTTANNLGLHSGNTAKLRYTIYGELFADCMAGTWGADLQRQGRLDNIAPGDYTEAVNALMSIGDPAGTPWNDPNAHGSGSLRRAYMDYGWRYGAQACVNWLRS